MKILPDSYKRPHVEAKLTHSTPKEEPITITLIVNESKAFDVIEEFAKKNNLETEDKLEPASTIKLKGGLTQLCDLFGVKLEEMILDGKTFRHRTGFVYLPDELVGHVKAVLGFDNRPVAKALRKFKPSYLFGADVDRSGTAPQPAGTFLPDAFRLHYNFPTDLGKGQTIALIELGGGYRTSDLATYWTALGITGPTVTTVSVDGATNDPTTADSADGEVVLDIQVAGALAPQATIMVYFAPNTDQGFLDAINAAVNHAGTDVISISWGSPEVNWTTQSLTAFNTAIEAATKKGITVTVAAGDNGSSDGANGDNVDFPASSPYALACGGTTYKISGEKSTEVVWSDTNDNGSTGGGVSTVFPVQPYQSKTILNGKDLTFRGVPDVAGNADPDTGYVTLVDGQWGVVGGTSAVAPLWAALIAVINQTISKKEGLFQNVLYNSTVKATFRDILSGSNGTYSATVGWDACTGLGTPNGKNLVNAIITVEKPPVTAPTQKK